MFDEIDHPDLREVGRRLQARLDRVLEAEQEAAGVLARRTATLRDRLLDAEETGRPVTLTGIDGADHHGWITATTVDHVELDTEGRSVLLPLDVLVRVVIE